MAGSVAWLAGLCLGSQTAPLAKLLVEVTEVAPTARCGLTLKFSRAALRRRLERLVRRAYEAVNDFGYIWLCIA